MGKKGFGETKNERASDKMGAHTRILSIDLYRGFALVFMALIHFSLTFYFLHYMLLAWPLALLYLITGRYMMEDLMGAVPALLCGVGAVAFLEILIFYWGKAGSRYSLEWFLVRLTKRVVPDYKRSISMPGKSSDAKKSIP